MMPDDVRDLYQDIVLDRSRNPRHLHALPDADARAVGDNPFCGDRVEVALRFAPDGRVADAAFEGRGCAISLASADLMLDVAHGRTKAELASLAAGFAELARTGTTADPALDPLKPLSGVAEYPSRIRCATLPWSALTAALAGAAEDTP